MGAYAQMLTLRPLVDGVQPSLHPAPRCSGHAGWVVRSLEAWRVMGPGRVSPPAVLHISVPHDSKTGKNLAPTRVPDFSTRWTRQ